ncbi:MAG: NUDIX domain-containing protein [Bacilli bacterium]|nr:NUDIX domain-containing protein [Bacilli bacterium]
MSGKKESVDFQPINVDFLIRDINEKITVKLDRPDLIFGGTFLSVSSELKKYEGMKVLMPITHEELPIIVTNRQEAHLGIPAHIEEDYKIALEKNLPIKQVIMPVNASLDDNKPRVDKEWSIRENVVLIVKHWSEDKYLYIDYKKQNWKCFISGGVEKDETYKEAAIRELKEESGYTNIKEIQEMPFKMANVFYAAHKGVNRYSTVISFYIELLDGDCLDLTDEEKEEHEVKWETKENLYEILKNGFTDQIWLLKQHLHEIGAYTGRGKYINSEFLNDLEDMNEAFIRVNAYLNGDNLNFCPKCDRV